MTNLIDAVLDDEAFASLPNIVASRLGARSSLLMSFRCKPTVLEQALFSSHFTPDILTELNERSLERIDIWMNAGLRHGVFGKAYNMEQFVSEDEFRRSELRNEVLLPYGDDTGRSAGIFFKVGNDNICLGAQRPLGEAAFSAADLAQLQHTSLIVARVLEARHSLREQHRKSSDLRAIVTALDEAVLLVDRDLRLVEVNLAAEKLLQRAERGVSLRSGRLSFVRSDQAQAIAQCVTETIRGKAVPRSRFLVPDTSGKGCLSMAILPVPHPTRPVCMVRLEDPTRARRSSTQWMQQQFGASRAEAAVAEALMEGLTPAQVAESRNVSLPTIRTQIRQVLEKTGSSSILALQRLLSRLP